MEHPKFIIYVVQKIYVVQLHTFTKYGTFFIEKWDYHIEVLMWDIVTFFSFCAYFIEDKIYEIT